MAKPKKTPEKESKKKEYQRLEYGLAAGKLAESEKYLAADIALKEYLRPQLGKDAQAIFDGPLFDKHPEHVIDSLSKTYNDLYEKALGEEKITEMFPYLKKDLSNYLSEDELKKAESFYNEFGKDNAIYGKIESKYNDAILDLQKTNISKEDKEKAEKIVKSLKPFMDNHKILFSAKINGLTKKVMEDATKKSLKNTIDNLPLNSKS